MTIITKLRITKKMRTPKRNPTMKMTTPAKATPNITRKVVFKTQTVLSDFAPTTCEAISTKISLYRKK